MMNQTKEQFCVLNYDDKACFELAQYGNATIVPFSRIEELEFGAYVKDDKIVIRNQEGELIDVCRTNTSLNAL